MNMAAAAIFENSPIWKVIKDVGTPHMYLANLLSKSAENLPENIFEVADHEKNIKKFYF